MKMEAEQVHQKLFKIGQLSGEGSKYHHGDDLENALECYKEAYKLSREINDDKTERTCAFNLGAEYIALGKYEDGLVYLHKAVPPKNQSDECATGDLYFNMGLGHENMDRAQEALKFFLKAHKKYEKYERDKTDMHIICLEKCFKLYHDWKDFVKAADICKQMADIFNGKDELSKAEKLCDRASVLRLAYEKTESIKAALECNEVMENYKPQGQECTVAGKIWNDLGLVFTQLQQYDKATRCFEKAVEEVWKSHKSNPQLEAVVLQNLGAAYNFKGDYQRAIKFHEDAATKYASINYRNGQGQCFTNLAFALSQLGEREMKQAEIAFHHALLASVNTGDMHMKWQALEGLGAVNYNQGQIQDAVDFFIEALQCAGDNKTASERIKNKMMYALKGPDYAGRPYSRGQSQMYAGTHMTHVPGRRVLMSTHGPVEEHNKLSTTPRSGVIETVMTKKMVPVAGEQPAMAVVQETSASQPRRLIRLRKKDSIGPYHHPKVALGLGSINYGSPRTLASDRRNTILQEDSESESDSSSASGSSSESETGEDEAEDEADQAKEVISSEKIDRIFARPASPQLSPVVQDEQGHLSLYEAQLRAKAELEEQEENEDSDSSDESSSDDDSDDDSDDESDETETRQENRQLHAHPPVPAQPPPNTTLVSSRHLDTYLTPAPHDVRTVADVHQQSDSSYRVARQQQQQQQQQKVAESPPESSSSAEGSESDGDGDDENEEKDPYATIDATTKLKQSQGQGNDNPTETGFKRQRSSEGRRGENFFDSDRSEKPTAGEDTEDPYHSLNFDREGQPEGQPDDQSGQQGESSSSAMKFEELPRGQKEVIMAQYHHEHQNQGPPDLPPRTDEKSSKTCVIM